MKKNFLAILTAAITVASVGALVFSGCGENNENVKRVTIDDQTSYVFVASSEVMTITDTTSVEDYLNALKDRGEIEFDGYTGDYGYFITSVNGTESQVISSTANSYEGYDWAFYIDFMTLEGDDAYYASDYQICEYEGKTLYYANNGISYTPCVEGHTYALVYNYSIFSW